MSLIEFEFLGVKARIEKIHGHIHSISGEEYLSAFIRLEKPIEGILGTGMYFRVKDYIKEELIEMAKEALRESIEKHRRKKAEWKKQEERRKRVEEFANKLNKKF